MQELVGPFKRTCIYPSHSSEPLVLWGNCERLYDGLKSVLAVENSTVPLSLTYIDSLSNWFVEARIKAPTHPERSERLAAAELKHRQTQERERIGAGFNPRNV